MFSSSRSPAKIESDPTYARLRGHDGNLGRTPAHALSRSRPVQGDLRRGPADLSDPPGPDRGRDPARLRVPGRAADRQRVLAVGDSGPAADIRAGGAGLEPPDRVRRPA